MRMKSKCMHIYILYIDFLVTFLFSQVKTLECFHHDVSMRLQTFVLTIIYEEETDSTSICDY